MTQPRLFQGQPTVRGPGIADLRRLLRSMQIKDLSIASIGPIGTSADGLLRELGDAVGGAQALNPILLDSFPKVMNAVLDGQAHIALVPSAYRDITAFHWHADLELKGVVVHPTPMYGLASRTAVLSPDGRLTLAAMSEVKDLLVQLAPNDLDHARLDIVSARSTSDAAALVAEGRADLALCNELGRQRHGLCWVGSRPGADMVWVLFARR